ncbi:hypothetical protein AVEN_197426-1 [Araneus ventricosus]|uniref:Uncharacterized protein n=1 Tax=Araneus ventricosus TaxID=182803 RepID=A0A4Y2IBH2_ARAVE|nr:hypothetical protein AVEN_197426-1 [Araneus ventricosus]
MKLVFCLALFSLSNAELLFRLLLHRNMSVSNHLDQMGTRKSDDSAPFLEPLYTNPDARNVYNRDTGFIVSGDCNIMGDDVHNPGAGNCSMRYGDCIASTSSRPSTGGGCVRKINDVFNAGAGSFFITYFSSSTSGEELVSKCCLVGETRDT